MDGEPRAKINPDLVRSPRPKVVKQAEGEQRKTRKEQAATKKFLKDDQQIVDVMTAERREAAERGGKEGDKNVSAASLGQIKIDAKEAAVKAGKGEDEVGVIGAQAVSDAILPKK